MRKFLFYFVGLAFVGCSDKLETEYATDVPTEQIKRLEVLAGIKPKIVDVVQHNDSMLEKGVGALLQQDRGDIRKWSKATACIVETKTGKIRANVAYVRKGETFEPCVDTYDHEQSEMEYGSSYLALLSSGKTTPSHVYDTGFGVYGKVRDQNWRRGGNGAISLERALEVQSPIAFTKAKEQVYGGNTTSFDAQISDYMVGMPNSPMGILTFYNAIANGGKMLQLVSEGDGSIVLQEQMAQPEYIEMLQDGLEHCVSQGLMRKAGRDYVRVSACGRMLTAKDNHIRMELFGYFPSKEPLYTIMVILEKDGLPAGTGAMCGPIFAEIVDLLVDTYGI